MWYDGFLAHDDQTLRAEEYEAMISFAKAKRTPLQSIVKYGAIVYNLDKGQAINADNNPLREIKIDTDVHEYRARLKYPDTVHVSSYTAGDGGAISASGTKFDGRVVPTGQGVVKLGTYSQGAGLDGLKEARAITENLALENQTTHEVYTVVDVDPVGNAILIRRASASDGNLPGTIYGGNAPAATDLLTVQSPSLYERDFASEGNGLEKTAKYVNYAQFFDVKYGQSISAEQIRFQGGSVLDAMNRYKNEVMGQQLEVALLWGQGKYIEHPTDEGNRQQFMQGVIPALANGPAAADLVTDINGHLTFSNTNEALDKINHVDGNNCPCLVSRRWISNINALDRDKVRIDFRQTAAGLQILTWKSDFGVQEFIYEPYLDDRKILLPSGIAGSDGTKAVTVDCIKYDMAAYAKLCKLVPLTIRTDIGKYSGSTMLYTWMYTILTAEWGHPELGGLVCGVKELSDNS